MALDKFISSVRSEVAKRFDLKTDAEIDAFFIGLEESAKDNQQSLEKRDKMLRDTVEELCEAKRLLKAAVEDFDSIYCRLGDNCEPMPDCGECPYIFSKQGCYCKWRYADIALKLIGATNDEP